MRRLKIRVSLWQFMLLQFFFFFAFFLLSDVISELARQGRSIWILVRFPLFSAVFVTLFSYSSARSKAIDDTDEIARQKRAEEVHNLISQGLNRLRFMAVENGLNFDELIASGKSIHEAAGLIYERDKRNNRMQIN